MELGQFLDLMDLRVAGNDQTEVGPVHPILAVEPMAPLEGLAEDVRYVRIELGKDRESGLVIRLALNLASRLDTPDCALAFVGRRADNPSQRCWRWNEGRRPNVHSALFESIPEKTGQSERFRCGSFLAP